MHDVRCDREELGLAKAGVDEVGLTDPHYDSKSGNLSYFEWQYDPSSKKLKKKVSSQTPYDWKENDGNTGVEPYRYLRFLVTNHGNQLIGVGLADICRCVFLRAFQPSNHLIKFE